MGSGTFPGVNLQGRLLELLASVDQREITALLLDINDDINNQMLRYERLKCLLL